MQNALIARLHGSDLAHAPRKYYKANSIPTQFSTLQILKCLRDSPASPLIRHAPDQAYGGAGTSRRSWGRPSPAAHSIAFFQKKSEH
jgi:hypothetical protein